LILLQISHAVASLTGTGFLYLYTVLQTTDLPYRSPPNWLDVGQEYTR